MKCPRPTCGYEWTPRTKRPKKCPKCNQWIKVLALLLILSVAAHADYPLADPVATQNDLAAMEMGRQAREESERLHQQEEDRFQLYEENERRTRERERWEELQKAIDKLNCEKTSKFCF